MARPRVKTRQVTTSDGQLDLFADQRASTPVAPAPAPPTVQRSAALDRDVPSVPAAVRIECVIQHELDNRTHTKVLAQGTSVLGHAHDLFSSYIKNTAMRSEWRGAFLDPAGDVVACCKQLLDTETAFVDASRWLADRLFDYMMQRPNNISPGDLAVAIFRADDLPGRHIALLKLDIQSWQLREYQALNGKLRAVYHETRDLMPNETQLQKCALISEFEPGRFSATLLDNQAGPDATGVAAFFYRSFLQLALVPTPRRQTKVFLSQTRRWLDENSTRLAPGALITFIQARQAALAQTTLDVRAFADAALPANAALRTSLLAGLTEQLSELSDTPVFTFAVDAKTAAHAVQYATFELDDRTVLKMSAETLERLRASGGLRRVGNRYELELTSLTLREVSD